MGLHRTVMVLGVVAPSHGGAVGQGLAARPHPTPSARDTRAAPGTGSLPGHGLRLSQATGSQVEPSGARLQGPALLGNHWRVIPMGSVGYWGIPVGWAGTFKPITKTDTNSNCDTNLNIKIALP